ncbi:hypothetical protein L1987_70763 [Smallanthus sonchifolius]|uniref:Uncharacterized protein n=1 Tax=Smallanthus sonchifolius TaxID=185202 RepID=A0ACB9AQS8_9ASTR|nr:hypothetical protein L1987_70763 [Smallanthus sonchifolius]
MNDLINQCESIAETDDENAYVSETVKADEVCDVDDIKVGLGFSEKSLVSSDISQDDDCKRVSPVSKNKVDAIPIHTTEKLPSPSNRDKVAERLKNKRVEERTKAEKLKRPFKACFKCGQGGHLIKNCKQVDEASSSTSRKHNPYGKGNKNCFSRSKPKGNNSLNNQMKNYPSISPYPTLSKCRLMDWRLLVISTRALATLLGFSRRVGLLGDQG